MVFNSLAFFFFFIITTALYFGIPQRWRWVLLLAGSVYFYMAYVPIFILVLALMIGVDYVAGIHIERAGGRRRLLLLVVSLLSNIGILVFFKYFNFFSINFSFLISQLGGEYVAPLLPVLLPLGISFHTFQAMSYTIEVYRGRQKAEKHLGIYALYVMFYPQLVAGPIERPYNMLPQLKTEQYFDYARVVSGLKLMLWGLFKKVVIADRLAVVVGQVYDNPEQYSGLPLVIATIFFAFQIYCDFSGYTDIAIGSARVLGINLMKNFRQPYFATSIGDFWKCWHISLSTWFRDYVYIPLGGNKVKRSMWCFNILLTFILSGFWHGAGWNFIIWGALHGLWLIGSKFTAGVRVHVVQLLLLDRVPSVHHALKIVITFTFVCFSWIFFRAETLPDALYIVTQSFHVFGQLADFSSVWTAIGTLSAWQGSLILSFLAIFFLIVTDSMIACGVLGRVEKKCPTGLVWAGYYVMIFLILFLGEFNGPQFIYFQF